MKYTIKSLYESNILSKNDDYIVYEINNNRVAICRDSGSLGGRNYYHAIVNGKTVATRCKMYTAEQKAIEYLNKTYAE